MRLHPATTLLLSATLAVLAGCAGERAHRTAWPDGRPQQVGQLDGYKPVGPWTTYHADGTLASSGLFIDGRQDGRWLYGHPGGGPGGVGHWRAGVQHGWWSSLSPEGRLLSAGLMRDGRRIGPWLVEGALRLHSQQPVVGGDTVTWSDGAWSVSWLVGATSIEIAAQWDGAGSPWRERVTDAPSRDALAALLAGPAPPAATAAGQADAEQPAPTVVEATPLPPLIHYGAIIRAIAGSIRDDFTGDLAAAMAVTPPPPPPARGDPASSALLGKPLPQARFLGSAGEPIDLTAPARTTVVVLMRGFSGSVCLYCASQTAAIADAAASFREAGIDVVVIYPGAASSIPAFLDAVRQLRNEPPPVPVALDINQLLVRALGVEGDLSKPTSLILDRRGNVAWAYIGTSMKDRPSAADLLAAARAVP